MPNYKHILKTNTIGTDSTYVDGHWVPGTPAAEIEEPCRAESSSSNGYLTTPDGKKLDFSWIVYFPLSVLDKSVGEPVKIYRKDGVLIVDDTVKRFQRSDFNCRAWL